MKKPTATRIGGRPAFRFPGSEGWVDFRIFDGRFKDWWFKGSEWNEELWGPRERLGRAPAAITTPAGNREVFYFDSAPFSWRWRFQGSEWNLERIIY